MNRNVNWEAFQRYDNTSLIETLSGFASALKSQQSFSELYLQQMRATLVERSSEKARQHPNSTIDTLITSRDNFFNNLISRYGCENLFGILTTISIKSQQDTFCAQLADKCEVLMQKAKLFINSSSPSYEHRCCTRYVNVASTLITFGEQLHTLIENIRKNRNQYMKKMPTSICALYEEEAKLLDEKVAQYLGFESISTCPQTAGVSLAQVSISISILEFVAITNSFHNQLKSCLFPVPEQTEHSISWLISESERISRFLPLRASNAPSEELRRSNLVASTHSLYSVIDSTINDLVNSVKSYGTYSAVEKPIIVKSELSYCISYLIEKGYPPEKASILVKKLEDYCNAKQVAPARILAAEISQIDNEIPEHILNVFKETRNVHNDHTAATNRATKKGIWDRVIQLGKILTITNQSNIILFLSMFTFSCGIKTVPLSNVVDARPPMPFKTPEKIEGHRFDNHEYLKNEKKPSNTRTHMEPEEVRSEDR